MRRIAIVSQPMRATQCRDFLREETADQVILTRDARLFADLGSDSATGVVVVDSPFRVPPTERLLRSRVLKRLLSSRRSTTTWARWVERTIKRIAWRFRYLDRLATVRRSRKPQRFDSSSLAASPLLARLEEQQSIQPIQQLVVFDLFDLPVAVQFGRRHGVEVLVR